LIGVDTNVLLRSLIHDDPAQGRRVALLAERIAEAGDNLFVDDVVLCETVWTLRTGFKLSHERIAEVVEDLIETALFIFEDRNLLREALRAYRTGPADFPDYVIGLRNARAGCDHTVTFDRALKAHSTFVLL
jgi:predicted nucleic-acid-binding protein